MSQAQYLVSFSTSHGKPLACIFSENAVSLFIGSSIYNSRDVKKHLERIEYWLDVCCAAGRGGGGGGGGFKNLNQKNMDF
jgi:hypothetical protein